MQIKKKLAYIALSGILLLISHMLILQSSIPLLPLVQAQDSTNTKPVSVVEVNPEVNPNDKRLPPDTPFRGVRVWALDPVCQMVFFAVLEGLYTDGVSNEIVDLIIPRNPITGEQNLKEHFVNLCPLCHPALDAFRVYRLRPPLTGVKRRRDAFTFNDNQGIDTKLVESLKSENKAERHKTVQSLINSWVKRRLDLMHLTPEEREKWSRQIEVRRKAGMDRLKGLKSTGEYSSDWAENCAICDGTLDASKLPIRNTNK